MTQMAASLAAGLDAPAINATDFLAAQRANRRNTDLLVVVLLLLGAALGYVLGWGAQNWDAEDPLAIVLVMSPWGIVGGGVLLAIGCMATAVTFAAGGRVILRLTGARLVDAEEEPVLHNVVEEMAVAAGLPKPEVAVIPTAALNAFATGMDPKTATIGVTLGLLKDLSREELQGVVAHETAHILNGDIRYLTAVGVLVGLIALIGDGVARGARRGVAGGGRRRPWIVPLIVMVFAVLAPIAAQLVRLAVSRQREYLADATAVQLARNPRGLIAALRKLGRQAEPFDGANRATQHMFIVNPLRDFAADAGALFATHPPIEKRIERLANLGRV